MLIFTKSEYMQGKGNTRKEILKINAVMEYDLVLTPELRAIKLRALYQINVSIDFPSFSSDQLKRLMQQRDLSRTVAEGHSRQKNNYIMACFTPVTDSDMKLENRQKFDFPLNSPTTQWQLRL